MVQVVGAVFPLTGSLRGPGGQLEHRTAGELAPTLLGLGALSALLLVAASLILRVGEARARRTGALSLA
ncbi:hypothetical protein [Streptomyces lateritius]|uniref:hypothetical protein n=1 Tax=Streptomyces lateritius TaxID=67313 RepID=UPI0021AB8DE7|nr:hypothetical protein [Streptomyces lateritius]